MTVYKLIEALSKVEDKSTEVIVLVGGDEYYPDDVIMSLTESKGVFIDCE